MADPLLTTRELAVWTQKDPDVVAVDPLALEVIDKISELARDLGGHPEWTLQPGEDQAPFGVRMVVLTVAKRCYENPRQVKSEGGVGPIGGDTVLDAAALLFELTESERATLTQHNPDGDPQGGEGNVFTIPITTGGPERDMVPTVLFVSDDQQINLETSQDPRPWMIPMFSPGEPGDPNLYVED